MLGLDPQVLMFLLGLGFKVGMVRPFCGLGYLRLFGTY